MSTYFSAFVASLNCRRLPAVRTITYRNAMIDGWLLGCVDWSTVRAVCSK